MFVLAIPGFIFIYFRVRTCFESIFENTSNNLKTSDIYFSVSFLSYISQRQRQMYMCLYRYLHRYVFLFPWKTVDESYLFPWYSVDSVDSVDSVKPVFAMYKAALLKIRYLLSLSLSLPSSTLFYLRFSPFPLFSFSFSLVLSLALLPSYLLPFVSLSLSLFSRSVLAFRFESSGEVRRGMKIPECNTR